MVWVETTTRRAGRADCPICRGQPLFVPARMAFWQIGPVPFSLLAGGGQDGRHQVGEALAHAGARLDHQMMPPADGPIDGLGHGELLAAMFVVRQPGGDPSAGAEDFAGRQHNVAV